MPELSSDNAGLVIGTTRETINRYVNRKLLPARRQGLRGIIRIDTNDLKNFAEEYGFRYDDHLAATLTE